MNAENKVFTTPSECEYIRFSVGDWTDTATPTYANDMSVNYPATNTGYVPYNPNSQDLSIPLPQIVYGGVLDVVSGKLVIDRKGVDLGSLAWEVLESGYSNFATHALSSEIDNDASKVCAICSNYKGVERNSVSSSADNYIWVNAYHVVDIKDTAKASLSAEQFKTAMSGVMCVYLLATPIEIDLTPTEVKSLLGDNNVWSDSGTVDVEYRADTSLVIDKILEALA